MQFVIADIMPVPKIHKHQSNATLKIRHAPQCMSRKALSSLLLFLLLLHLFHSFLLHCIISLTNSLVSHGFFIKWPTCSQGKHLFYLPTRKKDTEHMENQKSGDVSLDLAFLFADPSLDFIFLKHKMQGLKISALNVPFIYHNGR